MFCFFTVQKADEDIKHILDQEPVFEVKYSRLKFTLVWVQLVIMLPSFFGSKSFDILVFSPVLSVDCHMMHGKVS